MGDPKKVKKKYSTPIHPWQKDRIEEEIALKKEYGLKNKQEIWMIASKLKNFQAQVKKLNAMRGKQAEKESAQLRDKLMSLGLIKADSQLDTILGLETKDLMERRLQTIVFRKSLARSIGQARQFIVHRHITIAGNKITAPSHLVKVGEETQISFVQTSALSDPNHPERYEEPPKDRELKKKEKRKTEKKEEIAAFEEVPKDEEAIVKNIEPKKPEKEKVTESAKEEQEKKKEEKKKETVEKKEEVKKADEPTKEEKGESK